MKLLGLLLLIVLAAAAEQSYKKYVHNTDPEAKCLDGTPGLLYLHEGGDKSNFLIFFYGGGYCGETTLGDTIQSCYQRSLTPLGSSTQWPETLQAQGYLSTDANVSQFATWTKVIFGYCDGAMHQGYSNASVKYKGKELFFRGAAITRSHFKWLNEKYGMANAKKIVLTGASAGGIATFLWTNYLSTIVNNPLSLYSVVDSGVFMNYPSSETNTLKVQIQMENLFKISNRDEKTPIATCNRAQLNQQYRCLFLQYAFTSIPRKTLLINSQYDSWAISHLIDLKCDSPGTQGRTLSKCTPEQMTTLEDYRKKYRDFISNFMQFSWNSVWTISCSNHVYAAFNEFYNVDAQRVPMTTGLTAKNAIQQFVFNDERIFSVDTLNWPNNKPCAY